MSKAACQSAAPLPCKAQSRTGQPDRAADLCLYGTALPAEGRARRLVIANLDGLTIPQPSCFVNPLFQVSNKNNRISGCRKSTKPSPSPDNLRPKSRACGSVGLRTRMRAQCAEDDDATRKFYGKLCARNEVASARFAVKFCRRSCTRSKKLDTLQDTGLLMSGRLPGLPAAAPAGRVL